MIRSHVVDIAGVFAGAAIRKPTHFEFVAVHPRLSGIDRSEWPSLSDLRRAASYVMTTGRLPERCGLPSEEQAH